MQPSNASANEIDHELIEFATALIEAVSDDEIHTVAAAVRDDAGQMHRGVNLAHFTGGPCAELVTLATARAQGAVDLVSIVAVGNNGRGVLAPCGRDRQVFLDYYPSINVIVPTPDGLQCVDASDLLPFGYIRD